MDGQLWLCASCGHLTPLCVNGGNEQVFLVTPGISAVKPVASVLPTVRRESSKWVSDLIRDQR